MGDQDGGDCSDRRCPYQVAWSAGPPQDGQHPHVRRVRRRRRLRPRLGRLRVLRGLRGPRLRPPDLPERLLGSRQVRLRRGRDLRHRLRRLRGVPDANGNIVASGIGVGAAKVPQMPNWDSGKVRMCVCERLHDIDCSRRMCPQGNDVMDERNSLDEALKYQKQTVTLIGAGALGDGIAEGRRDAVRAAPSDEAITDACFADLVDKSFALTFTSKLNQSLHDEAHHRHVDRDGQRGGLYDLERYPRATRMISSPSSWRSVPTDTGATSPFTGLATQQVEADLFINAGRVTAPLTTSMAVKTALHELPNYVIDDCEVTCTYEWAVGVSTYYPSVKCELSSTGRLSGPQYLLEVEADQVRLRCTPQFLTRSSSSLPGGLDGGGITSWRIP